MEVLILVVMSVEVHGPVPDARREAALSARLHPRAESPT